MYNFDNQFEVKGLYNQNNESKLNLGISPRSNILANIGYFNENQKNEIGKHKTITINELRSRVYKTSVGVLPTRKSNEIEELKVMLKGKSIENQGWMHHDERAMKVDTPIYEEVPMTTPIPDIPFQFKTNLDNSSVKLPAILPTRGTADTVKLSERPKPSKKVKSEYFQSQKSRRLSPINTKDRIERNDSQKNNNIESYPELDYVQDLVKEAHQITKYKYSHASQNDNVHHKSSKPILEKKLSRDYSDTSLNKEKTLLQSVESLVLAIKSGKLLEEQELTDKRIQSILNRVIEKREQKDIEEESFANEDLKNEKITETMEEKALDDKVDTNLELDQRNLVDQPEVHTQSTSQQINNNKNSIKKSQNQDQISTKPSKLSLKSSFVNQHNYVLLKTPVEESYENILDLPYTVTNEDIISIKSKKIEIKIDDEKPKIISSTNLELEQNKNLQTDETVKRNAHQFCFYNENNTDALLSDKLRNVTRKYHCRSKYSVLASITNTNAVEEELETPRSITKFESIIRSSQAAERVIENSLFNKNNLNGGNSDSTPTLKEQSDKFEENYILEAQKMEIQDLFVPDEYSMHFLRPSPPKMMIKRSVIKNSLFPRYESVVPLSNQDLEALENEDNMNTYSSKLPSIYDKVDKNKEDEDDEQIFLEKLTREKIIARNYHSDSEVYEDEPSFSFRELKSLANRHQRISNSLNKINSDSTDSLHIDSNYNDAIEEAYQQKTNIKMKHEKMNDLTNASNIEEEPELEKESSSSLKQTNLFQNSSTSYRKYFPKIGELTQAEINLENARENENSKLKIRRKKPHRKMSKSKFTEAMINHVETFLTNLNNDDCTLVRTNSLNDIKFPRKMAEEPQLRIPKSFKNQVRSSLPNLLDFETFKKNCTVKITENKFEDEVEDIEREWVRKIWNIWFDEVIPPLDGGNKNDEENETEEVVETYKDSSHLSDKNSSSNEKTRKNSVPYESYSEVEFSVGLDSIEAKIVVEVQDEINQLTTKIENKSDVFSLTRRGALYRKLGFIKLALHDLNQVILMEPHYVDAYWHRHLIFLIQNFTDKALDDLNTILKINKNHAGAYLSRGNIYFERNDPAMAIVNYSQAIKYNPTEYQAYYKRAKMYELRGDLRMAMDDYLTTTKLNPKIVDAWFKHGMNYFKNKNWQYAIVDFTELLKHNPNQSEARLYRGKCHLYLKEYQMAINDFSVAIHLDPNNWQAYFHRGCLLRKLFREQSLKDLSISIMIENSYDNIDAYLHRAILYYENKNFDEAIKDYESVLLLDKEFAPAYVNLGVIYMNVMSNYWKAIKCFYMAIKSNPIYIRAYMCRAQAYKKIHNLQQAYLDYSKAIHLDPLNTQIYIYRGETILAMKNFKLAAFCVQHAAFLNEGGNKPTKDADDLNTPDIKAEEDQSVTQKAVVYAFLKNFSKAFSVLDSELKLKPNRKTYNLLGKIFMDAKQWQEASDTFQKSIMFNKTLTEHQRTNYNRSLRLNQITENEDDLIDSYFMKGRCMIELLNYNEAYHCFQKVIEMRPSNPEAYYYRGLVRAYLHHQNCIQDFNKALAINPDFFEAYLARAAIYGLQNRHAKAILNCNEALRLNSKCVRGFLYRGALKFYSKSYVFAIHDFTDAIKLHQTCALAYYNRALCHEKIKNYSQALKDYSIVLLLGDYLKFKVCINRGLLYYNLGDYANALADFQTASENAPTDFKIKHIIGLCYHRLGLLDDAVKVLTSTIKLNTQYNNALISRGNVYVDYGHEVGFRRAYSDYAHALLKNPFDLDARINLAYLMQMRNRHKDAWRLFTASIAIQPNFAASYEGRSIICLQMSDMNAAFKDINHAIKLNQAAEFYVNRGVIQQFMGDNVNAMRDYQAALLIDPMCSLAYYNSGNIYLFHKQYSQALSSYNNAIEKCELKDETVYQNRGITKALMNLNAEAMKDFTDALRYNKYAAHIYMNRALLLFKIKDYKNAEKDLTTAIHLQNNDSLLYKLRGNCRTKLMMNEEALNDYKTAITLEENSGKH